MRLMKKGNVQSTSFRDCVQDSGAFEKLRNATVSFVMNVLYVSVSVPSCAWDNPAPTGRIFMKFDISVFFENVSRKFKFHYNLTTITSTVHAHRYTLLLLSRSDLLRMRNVSYKGFTETRTHDLC